MTTLAFSIFRKPPVRGSANICEPCGQCGLNSRENKNQKQQDVSADDNKVGMMPPTAAAEAEAGLERRCDPWPRRQPCAPPESHTDREGGGYNLF